MTARTLADIARLAGVSRTTASYVVNGKAATNRISEQTVARVLAVVEAHNFQVDAQAAALRRGVTHSLGLIIPDLENSSYARLAKRIEGGARAAGYYVFIACSEDQPDTERQLARQLRAKRCDALIVASCLPLDDPLYAELLDCGLPVIGLDRPMDSNRFRWVASSNTDSAQALTESVIGPETLDVLWLDALAGLSITQRRRAGFAAAVARAAPSARVHYLSGDRYDHANGRSLIECHLSVHDMPAALISAAYPLLDGAFDVLLDRDGELPMPRIATFGDDRLLDFLPVPVNSMIQQHDRVADIVLQRTLDALAGRYEPGSDRLPRLLRARTGTKTYRACSSTEASPR